jgi:hypothetical protein
MWEKKKKKEKEKERKRICIDIKKRNACKINKRNP